MKNSIPKVSVGVDISKLFLDIHLHPVKKDARFENNKEGIVKLLGLLSSYDVNQIVCESSGGYENLMMKELRKNGHKVWQVQARRIKAFITSEGINVKTDKIDAKMIALFASQKQSKHAPLPSSHEQERMRELVAYRAHLLCMLTEENNKIQHPQLQHSQDYIAKHITFMEKQLKAIERKIQCVIKNDKDLSHKAEIMQTIPGVGGITTCTLLAEVPELGNIDNKSIAALLGVAPLIRQSGLNKGKAATGGGRKKPKSVLYMAALVASKHNPVLRTFYQRLLQRGKAPKVALVAVMRKLTVFLNALVKKSQSWQQVPA
jgi:transposase